MKQEVIGYKAPYDMFGGAIPRGTIYKPLASKDNKFFAAVDEDSHAIDGGKTNLPKEIVETWEKVLEKCIFKAGDVVVSLKDYGTCRSVGDIFTVLRVTTDESRLYYKEEMNGPMDEFRLATKSEIEKYELDDLIKEARRRYPIGTTFIPVHDDTKVNRCIVVNDIFLVGKRQMGNLTITASTSAGYHFTTRSNGSHGNTGYDRLVYRDGKWADTDNITPNISINGYNGKFYPDRVEFGCAEIGIEVFISLYELNRLKLHNSNREIESVTIGKGQFSKEVIKAIAEYYLSNPLNSSTVCL